MKIHLLAAAALATALSVPSFAANESDPAKKPPTDVSADGITKKQASQDAQNASKAPVPSQTGTAKGANDVSKDGISKKQSANDAKNASQHGKKAMSGPAPKTDDGRVEGSREKSEVPTTPK